MKAVFLDRDGTITRDVNFCRRVEDLEILPGVPEAISLLNRQNFKVVVITNQSGIARGYFTEATLSRIHQYMEEELSKRGALIDAVYYCPHHPDDNCDCRKPKPGLILQAAAELGISLENSWMVGDAARDVAAGKAAGCKTVLLENDPDTDEAIEPVEPDYVASDLLQAVKRITRE
jgi:D-glycero-D-manno-heptose 1,7-bisphosphate phosphatase